MSGVSIRRPVFGQTTAPSGESAFEGACFPELNSGSLTLRAWARDMKYSTWGPVKERITGELSEVRFSGNQHELVKNIHVGKVLPGRKNPSLGSVVWFRSFDLR